MPLAEVAIPLTFTGGIDTKTDSKSVAQTRLLALENGVFDKNTTIIKRNGYDGLAKAIDGGTTYSTPTGLASRGSELILFADDKLYSYRDSSAAWSEVGRCQSIVHTERPIAATGTAQTMPDAASLNGVTVLAWEDSRGGVWWAVAELTSGRLLRAAEQLDASGQRPRVCVAGDKLHVYYAVAAATRIWCVVVNPVSFLAAPAPVLLVATLNATNPTFDAMTLDTGIGTGVVMAWALTTGGYQVAFVDPSGALGSATTGWPTSVAWAGDAITGPLAIANSSARPFVAVAYVATNNVNVRVLTSGDLSVSLHAGVAVTGAGLAPVRVAATAGPPAAGTAGGGATDVWVWAEEPSANPEAAGAERDHRIRYGWFDDAAGAAQAAAPVRGLGLASRGFRDGTGVYVIAVHQVPFFPFAALLRTFVASSTASTAPTVVAVGRLIVGASAGLPPRSHVSGVETDATNARLHRWVGCGREQVNAEASGLQFTETGLRMASLDFAHADAFQSVEFGADLVIGGAMPWRYDGDTVAELGFHTAPDGNIGAVTGAGGSLTASRSYLYTFNYEEIDAAGLIHPGAMSVGILVVLGAGETRVTFTLPTYRLTSKRRVRIGVFRTEANDTGGAPAMYRVSSLDPSATGSNGYVLSDPTIDTVSFVDDLSDALLLTRERAYTNEGVLSNDPVSLGATVAGGKSRLFFLDPVDPHVVRYTQARRDGYGPELAADLSLRIDQIGGDAQALGILDDLLVIFAERQIYFVDGPGPLPNPDIAPQIGFSPPVQIPSNVGCSTPRSLAITSDKILFQATDNRGIHEVDRSRAVNYVGAPVEAYNAVRIVSADQIPGKHRTVFLTATDKALVYDDYHGQWSAFTNHQGLDGVVAGGLYHYLRSNVADYRVFRASTSYLDAGVSILLYLETAWIKLTNYHQGLQRIWYALLLGAWKSSHVLAVKVANDYRPGWDDPYYLEVDASYTPAGYGGGLYGAGLYGGSPDADYRQRIHVSRKCQAIRFAIGETLGGEFSQAPPVGASFELTELLLTGGVMRPSATFAAGRTQ